MVAGSSESMCLYKIPGMCMCKMRVNNGFSVRQLCAALGRQLYCATCSLLYVDHKNNCTRNSETQGVWWVAHKPCADELSERGALSHTRLSVSAQTALCERGISLCRRVRENINVVLRSFICVPEHPR